MLVLLARMDLFVHKIQSGPLSWLWGVTRFSVKDGATLLPCQDVSHACFLDVGNRSVSLSYARAVHDRFCRLQVGLLSGDDVGSLFEEIDHLFHEDVPMDDDMRTLVNLLQIRLELLKPIRGR